MSQKIANEREITELKSDVLQGAKINEDNSSQIN